MIRTVCFFAALFTSLSAVPVFIGTNTGGGSKSKGIYLADFDVVTGRLAQAKLAAEYENPGFLAQHPEKPVLYACGRPKEAYKDGSGSVAAFFIGKDCALEFLGDASVGGKNACHIAVDATGRTVATANYGDGSISTLRLDENGVPGELVSLVRNEGSGPNKSRQEGPHAHGVYFDKANARLLVPDLGLDKVFVYPFDPASSKLGDAMSPLTTAPGAGPRHLAFSPNERHAYVINELDNSVLAMSYENGELSALGAVATLPAGFSESNSTAEVEVSEDGRFVYASNRGHDSILVCSRDAKTGELAFVQIAPCGGKTPRHFKIAPGGKWLLCAHQGSNTISVLPRDPETGKLGVPTGTVAVPSPICLLFCHPE